MLVRNSLNTYTSTPVKNLAGKNYSVKNQISFEAMKKSEFDGIDFAVVEKYKAPIEKFDTNQDLQNWANEKANEILNNDYTGRSSVISAQREKIIQNWDKHFFEHQHYYTPAEKFLILKSITKNLKPNSDTLPPELSQAALLAAIKQLCTELELNPRYQFDFNKMYMSKLECSYIDDKEIGETKTGWVVIPSANHDKKNFDSNVEKLKTLSARRWCTRANHSEIYLKTGDFHVYLDNGKPKIGLRFYDDKIVEIEGELNNNTIPSDYFQIVKDYISKNKFKTIESVQEELDNAENKLKIIENTKYDLWQEIKDNDVEKIFDYFNIKYETDQNGLLTMTAGYFQPDRGITWKDIGINENNLLKRIKAINGYCDMSTSDATDLGEVRQINGYLKLAYSKLNNLGKLEAVDSIDLNNSNIKSLGELKFIYKNGDFSNSNLKDLGQLRFIGGNADFSNSKISTLDKLEVIKGNAKFRDSEIKDLGNLYSIGGNADFIDTKIQELKNLQHINGDAFFTNSEIRNLNNLETIHGYADFYNSKISNLGKLKTIHGNAIFTQTPLTTLGNLEYIGGSIRFDNTNIQDLGNLKKIGINASFSNSKITTLNKLEEIKGSAKFTASNVIDLGRLQHIGGDADFSISKITNYKNLIQIDGDAIFDKGKIPRNSHIIILGRIIENSYDTGTISTSKHNYFQKLKNIFFH